MRTRIAIVLLVLLMLPLESMAQKGGRASSSRSSSRSASSRVGSTRSAKSSARKSSAKKSTTSISKKSTVAPRDGNGRIKRSAATKREFMKQTGYPKGRKGYVVDHSVPLECGGADTPANMQWQTAAEAKIKDRTERTCRRE